MLSKVLDKSTCADCRFCCSFRRCSLWETPLFPEKTMNRLSEADRGAVFVKHESDGKIYGQMDLTGCYRTQDSEEEAPCAFLDPDKGCMLSDEDKPFDCKIWPLRIMKKSGDNKCVIALTPTCPAINKVPLEKMKELVQEELGEKIYAYAKEYPYIVKEYREGFPVLMKKN